MAWTIQKTPLSRIGYRPALALLMVHLLFALLPPDARCCTTFCLERGPALLFGKNYDWNVEDGLVVVNKRGVAKTAMTETNPASWTSRYGSVTFNQYGREFPGGGINERGLVVELMWLEETEYPREDEPGALPTLQWIQYQLDNCATVAEVIASEEVVRITDAGSAKIHFLVADATGDVAAVEFLGGRMVATRGKDLPYPVLTNTTYEESAAYARRAGRRTGPVPASSLDRFARAASHEARAKDAAGAVENAFALLADVAQGDYTQWSIVYDVRERRVHFRTRLAPAVRWLDLDALPFSCDSPVQVMDVNAAHAGDASGRLAPYAYDDNYRLVRASFTKTPFLRAVPLKSREKLARYPQSTTCAAGGGRGSEK